MKLYSLGEGCTVLEWRGVRIMLDCALHLPSMQRFMPVEREQPNCSKWGLGSNATKHPSNGVKTASLPSDSCTTAGEGGDLPFTRIGGDVFIEAGAIRVRTPEWSLIDLAGVDAILISNAQGMLALPFVVSRSGFRGRVYATEPAVHIAGMMMQELVGYVEKAQYPEDDPAPWQNEDLIAALPPELHAQLASGVNWQTLYGRQDIEKAISTVQRVSFHQYINLLGVMEAVPVSSGFSLGSANWVLRTDNQKIVYIAESSLSPGRHPQPFDRSLFRNSDVMIVTGLSLKPQFPPEAMVQELCNLVGSTLSGGGRVLLPLYPGGVIFDLIEILHSYLYSAGHPRVPMYFISPVAEQALAYSNICAEWLCKSKQDKAYLPEWPFIHADLQQSGRLQHYVAADDREFATGLKEPCLVFCGHPSLRCGDVLHFINTWGHNPRNAIILTEPGYDYAMGLAPFKDVKCRTAYCPIDPRITYTDANAIIRALAPATVVAPVAYISGKATGGPSPAEANSIVAGGTQGILAYQPLDVVSLPCHRKRERAELSAELAMSLKLRRRETYGGGPGDNVMAVAPISASLYSKDHRLQLSSLSITQVAASGREPLLLGVPMIDNIVRELGERGIKDVHVEHKPQKRAMLLTIDSLSATVLLAPNKTKIVTTNEQTRHLLLEVIKTHTMETGQQW